MALDPNIALQYQGMRINDPMDQYGKAMSLAQMGMQGRYMQSKMDESQRLSQLAQNRQKIFAESGGDSEKLMAGLIQSGDMEGAQAYQEHLLNTQKTQADLEDKRMGTQTKKLQVISDLAKFGYDGGTMQHASMVADTLEQSGLKKDAGFIRGLIERYPNATPEQIRAFFKPYISSRLSESEMLMPKFEDIGGSKVNVNPNVQVDPLQKTQTPDSVASNAIAREGHAVTRRGQDISASTAMRGQDISANTAIRGQNMTNDRAIEKNRIEGAKPKLTEVQAKAQLYGTRAKAAHDILESLEGKYSPLAVNARMGAADVPLIGGITGAVANSMLSPSGQRAEQAQRDFVNAILRQESGAVISEPEFRNAQKQYFPQAGDSKEVLKQKRENRARAIKALDVMSGPAGGFSQPAQRPTGGIKFLGFE